MTNLEFATGLRLLADFYEQSPEMPQPYTPLTAFVNERENFVRAALTLQKGGRIEKKADPVDGTWPQYHALRQFGKIVLDVCIDRKNVCRLVSPAVYDCPDSLLEEAAEYTEGEAAK